MLRISSIARLPSERTYTTKFCNLLRALAAVNPPTAKAPIVLFTYYVRVAFPKSRHAVEARVRVPCLLYDL